MKVSLFLVILALANAGSDGKCRAIAMSGGGEKGSYEAGALTKLMELLPKQETQYDVVSGVSAGSLNGAAVSLFKPDEQDEFTDFILNDVWREATIRNLTRLWPDGFLGGFNKYGGFMDSTPLHEMLLGFIEGREIQRHVVFGTVDAQDGSYVEFKYAPGDDLEDAALHAYASSSIPMLWAPVIEGERVLIDGGSVWNTDLTGAVDLCRELGYEDRDIIIDTILCSESHLLSDDHISDYHSIKHYLRAHDISNYYKKMGDLERV